MKKKYIALSLATLLMGSHTAYADEVKSKKQETTVAQESNSTKGELLVVVNGHEIWSSYFDKSFGKMTSLAKNEKIKEIITSELLVQFASKEKLFKDKKVIEEINENKKQVIASGGKFTDIDYRMVLGLTVIDHLAKEFANKNVTQEDFEHYYKQRKKNFKKLPFSEAMVITTTEKEAKKIIEEMDKTSKNKQKDKFLSLAKQITTDEKNIYTGKIYKFGVLKTPYTLSLFRLKKDTYTKKPVKVDSNHYKVIYATDNSHTSKAPTLNELQSNIEFIVKHRKALEWVNDTIAELKKEAKIEIKKKF